MTQERALAGQTAIVTGGAKGIGRAIALELAALGADIVINYASSDKAAEETAKEIEALGVSALRVKADISKAEEVKRLFEEALTLRDRVDILVNNAGITRDNLAIRMSDEDFDAVIASNLRGAFLCMREGASLMVRKRYGRIINISSVVGVHGNAGQVNYSASKAGMIGMTKSLAKELAKRNITVNAIAPGFIESDMTDAMPEAAKEAVLSSIPAGRCGNAAEVAALAGFLAKKEASYITGQVIGVDGGMGA